MTSAPKGSIAVVDYCKGNLRSVEKGIVAAGFDAFITADPERIAEADGIVLPGVGSFYDAATYMEASGQREAILSRVAEGAPFLGICLGMQLLFERGTEGGDGMTKGLGLLPGYCERLSGEGVKVPHVGWNTIALTDEEDPLLAGIPDGAHFYFTHSYNCVPADSRDITSTTEHGIVFASSVRRGTIHGVQFHPEKSSTIGLVVLGNFGRIVEQATYERTTR